MAKIIRDHRLDFGALPNVMLDLSNLSPMERLLWGVLDSLGYEHIDPKMSDVLRRLGLSPKSRGSAIDYLAGLVRKGFLEVSSGLDRKIKVGHGFKWDKNIYELKLPDYCLVKSPNVRKLVLGEPVEANTKAWKPALGPSKAKARRAKWRAKKAQQNLVLDGETIPKPAVSLSSGDDTGLSSGDDTGLSSGDDTGLSSGDDTGLSSGDDTGLSSGDDIIDLKRDLVVSLPPTFQKFHHPRKAPVGWEGFAGAFEGRQDKRFIWTARARNIALEINDELILSTDAKLLDVVELKFIQNNFLNCPHWGTKERGAPLDALRKHLVEYLPTVKQLEMAKIYARQQACSHSAFKESHRITKWNGVSVISKCVDGCGLSKVKVEAITPLQPSVLQDEQIQQELQKLRDLEAAALKKKEAEQKNRPSIKTLNDTDVEGAGSVAG